MAANDVDITKSTKFLGVVIDENLKWDDHINNLNKKLSSVCYAMRVMVKYLQPDAIKEVYYANFESLVRYGIMFYGISFKSEAVFKSQKRMLRIMLGLKNKESRRGKFKRENILSFCGIYLMECLLFIFKQKHLFIPLNDNNYNTRTTNYQYPIHRLTKTEKHPSYMCVKIFNKLPDGIKKVENYAQYRVQIKNLLMALEPYNLLEYFA